MCGCAFSVSTVQKRYNTQNYQYTKGGGGIIVPIEEVHEVLF